MLMHSQVTQPSNDNYYEYVQNMDSYFDSINDVTPDSVKIPGFKDYLRWKDIWKDRVYCVGADTQGRYNFYFEHLDDYLDYSEVLPPLNSDFQWGYSGPTLLSTQNMGIVVSLLIDENDPTLNTIYAGTNASGLWKTLDGGQNWANITDGIPSPGLGVLDIAQDPVNPNTIYICGSGNFYGTGIYKSTDGGLFWSDPPVLEFDPKDQKILRKILIDPSNGNNIYVVVDGQVYRTMDGGQSWEIIFDELTVINPNVHWDRHKYLTDIEMKPGDPNTLYVSSVGIKTLVPPTHSMTAEAWLTNDAKAVNPTWTRLDENPDVLGTNGYTQRIKIAVDQANPNSLYLSYHTNYFILLKTIDNGVSFTEEYNYYTSDIDGYGGNFKGTGYFQFELECSKMDPNQVYVGAYGLDYVDLVLDDHTPYPGYINPTTGQFHVDQRCFKVVHDVTNQKEYLYMANDGGVTKADLSTNTFENINGNNFFITQYYGIACSEKETSFRAGGTQDNGYISNTTGSWTANVIGDAYEVIINPENPCIIYATNNGGGGNTIRKSTNCGASFSSCINGIPYAAYKNNSLTDRAFEMFNVNYDKLVIGYDDVYLTDDAAANWYNISNFPTNYGVPPGSKLQAIGISFLDDQHIVCSFQGPTWNAGYHDKKLFMTTDGGSNWLDIGSNLGVLDWTGITDITISPDDNDHFFIACGGFVSTPPIRNRVFETFDGGNTFTDISYNLPNLPMNCISYLISENQAKPMVGTDLGIYLYEQSNPVTSKWVCISSGLPLCMVKDLEVNYNSGKIIAGTFGRGIWESDLPEEDILEISSNILWSENKCVSTPIEIKSGGTLTVKENVFMLPGLKIIVEPGGELVVDGGKITSYNVIQWQGIEVWGNPNATQTPSSNQGLLVITNGGTIENAGVAVRVGSEDYTGKGGGIVLASAEFLNNSIGVYFDSYSYTSDNISYFIGCNFDNTKTYAGESTFTHVKLNDVRGIDFTKCSFANNSNYDNIGYGIYSTNSIFSVKGINSTSGWVNSLFENLDYGIYATASTSTRFAEIRHCNFTDNFKGVYLSAMTNALVTDCEFDVNTPFATNSGYGLYLDNCTAYTIEENSFASDAASPTGVGLIVHNSGEYPNEIYLNEFTNLEQGISAQELNRDFNDPAQGLQILCCDFDDCNADILVPRPRSKFWGIAPSQGIDGNTATDMAGNLFYYNSITDDYDDINNEGAFFDYYYPSNPAFGFERIKPEDYTENTVNAQENNIAAGPWTFDDGCPPRESGGSGGSEGMRSSMASAQQDIESLEATLSLLIDGGDTESLNTEVETSTPPETVDVYNELMDESPNLSETVVGTAIAKEDVLPPAMLRDVMVANPQSAKSDVLVEKLDERLIPLPEYMKAQILEGRSLSSLKGQLETKLAGHRLDKARAMAGLARYYVSELPNAQQTYDSLSALYQDDNSLQSKYKLAMLHFEKGEFLQGETILSDIPQQYSLDAEELIKHENMETYCGLLREL